MRKVKFTAQNYHDKLTQILTDFPILDEIHPFYADLINVLYDRDHYKLALGQLSTCRSLIDNLGKDYLRLLKYGDSLYRCKQLKRAALGRMCTLMRRQGPNLAYLEQVRQHLARLPSIDPNARTLIICGYPNVGKSSFMNNVTRANVEVQPYAFTTKSLFVGHTDYRYLRWQVIDTPGILDHPLEDRNTIEMQSITALAHLRAAILFLIDISEDCGYSVKQQVDLFNSIKPLFANKPLVLGFNKIDSCPWEKLPEESKELLENLLKQENVHSIQMSTMTGEGVSGLRSLACDRLLEQRVETKLIGKHIAHNMNRLHLAEPVPRDSRERPAFIPSSVLEKRKLKFETGSKKEDEDDDEFESLISMDDSQTTPSFGAVIFRTHKAMPLEDQTPDDFDPTIFGPDYRSEYLLADDSWKFDPIPEIINGKNIADYIDPDILERLEELEREEEERIEQGEEKSKSEMIDLVDDEEEQIEDLDEEEKATFSAIKDKKALIRQRHIERKNQLKNKPFTPRVRQQKTGEEFESHLEELGINPSRALKRARSQSRSRSRSQSRVGRSHSVFATEDGKKRLRLSLSKSKERSRSVVPGEGFKNIKQKEHAEKLHRDRALRHRNKQARKGEADRHIPDLKPKHLFSGKRGTGKTQRR